MIVDIAEGNDSVNETIKKLLDKADKPKGKLNMKRTVINLDDDVLARLEDFKAYEKESYNSVIARLIQSQK